MHDVNSGGLPQPIPETGVVDFPSSVSPDGSTLLFLGQTGQSAGDVYALSLQGKPAPHPVVQTSGYDGGAQLSSDGRWLAYVSTQSGQAEVYISRYPALDQRWVVSSQGGSHPLWRRDGRELFFRNGSSMFAVDVGRDRCERQEIPDSARSITNDMARHKVRRELAMAAAFVVRLEHR